MTGKRGRRSKQLLDGLKETKRYMEFKEEAVNRCGWKSPFGRSSRPVARQSTNFKILPPHTGTYF